MKNDEKVGVLIIVISIALIIIAFVLSSGYEPEQGFIWSFQYTMHLMDISIYRGDIRWEACGYLGDDCAEIKIKYIISILVVLLMYGILIYKTILKNPILYFKKPNHGNAKDDA